MIILSCTNSFYFQKCREARIITLLAKDISYLNGELEEEKLDSLMFLSIVELLKQVKSMMIYRMWGEKIV